MPKLYFGYFFPAPYFQAQIVESKPEKAKMNGFYKLKKQSFGF